MGLIDRIANMAADRVAQKLAGIQLPPGATVNENLPVELAQSQGSPASWADAFPTVPFGPGSPLPPSPIGLKRPDGGAYPRRTEYPVGANLPGMGVRPVPWRILRQAGEVDIIRRAIELRKTEISSLDWDIVPARGAVEDYSRVAGVTKAKAQSALMNDLGNEIARARAFWKKPDPLNNLDTSTWLGMALEEHFVIDALSIYPRLTLGGDLLALNVIDGSTIKPLLDADGNRPRPPAPAFQQMLQGFPRGDYHATEDGRDVPFGDMVYLPRLVRTHSMYGFSNVEQVLNWLDLWLKRTDWLRTEYTDGTTPNTWITTDEKFKPDQHASWERVLNAALAGDAKERHRLKLLPSGMNPVAMSEMAEKYQSDYDEFLLKVVCAHFDVQPIELGFEPKGGLGGKGFSESTERLTYRRSIRPTVRWVSGWLDQLSYDYLGMSPLLNFKFLGAETEDDTVDEKTNDMLLRSGQKTLNDLRGERGDPLYDFEEANEPFLITGNHIIFIRGAIDRIAVAEEEAKAFYSSAPPAETAAADNPSADDTGKIAAAEEGKTFLSFAAKRAKDGKAWRPFAFKNIEPELATQLNALGAEGRIDEARALLK